MTNRQILMRKISSYSFAIYDLHLFMDTHPSDTKTQKKIEELKEKLAELTKEYQEKYGPLFFRDDTAVAWVKDPWPWEG
ncbi:MAG: spore coat protein CotJB [Acutalibacteraceae bacterium]